ncbi:unnamed protein product [Calypogeia fissa]
MVYMKLVESPYAEGSGYKDGIYYSKRPFLPIPEDPYLDLTSFVLDHPYMDRVALIDAPTGKSMTYAEVKQLVYSVGAGLADIGVKQGDVVMLLTPNGSHFPILVFAILSIGAVVTTVNPANLSAEISRQAKDSDSKFVISSPEAGGKVAALKLPIILIDTIDGCDVAQAKGITPVAHLSELYKGDPSRAPKVHIKQTDLALLLYSSGTTGLSKGVKLSHRNALSACILNEEPSNDPNSQRSYLVPIPFYHVYGLIVITAAQMKRGSKLIIMPRFELRKFLANIERYRATHLVLVPPILVALGKSPLVDKYDLSSVDLIGVGAAPVGKELIHATSQRFKGVFLRQGFGMTETSSVGMTTPVVANSEAPHGSVGIMAANMQAKIVDLDSGKPLPSNQKGELWIRGPFVMEGYLNNEKATAETLDKDGWLHSGDIAYFDEAGYLFIVDRLKELIKYNGLQVAPAELEGLLHSHPEILDVAVTGFPDERTGQIPVAFVVRKSSSLTEEDVMSFVAKQVAPYKKVRKVFFVEIIPKSPSGKILRRELKAPLPSKL